jgi:O-antigen/teichoic acid export membrane protein/GT2 family glycosyltransferase
MAPMMLATKARPVAAPITRVVLRTVQNPLLRNGHLLTLSSALSALIGVGYWVVTARSYDPAAVGRNYAAISMMMFLAALAQLDLSSAMVRFIPTVGRRALRFIACAYLASGLLAIVVSACFLALVRQVAPGMAFLRDPVLAGSFVCATAAYTIFALQDSVLTGLRRTAWVPLENAIFACVKVVLVVVLAAAMPAYGIFASWALSLSGAVLLTSVLLFGWAIPAHQRHNGHNTLPPLRQIVRFIALDYVGVLCSIAAITMLPILILNVVGPQQAAYFSLAWVIAFSLHLVNINMGSSLVVETAVDQSQLARSCRQVLSHTSRLLVPAVLVLIMLAPYLLGVFGQPYRSASGLLRLLVLASLPHLLVSTAVSSARAQRRIGVVVGVLGSVCVLALGLAWLLLHAMGILGVGLAWLLAQSLVAGALLIRRDLWLNISSVPVITRARGARLQRLRWMLVGFLVRVVSTLRVGRWIERPRARWRARCARRELAALLPGLLPTVPALAGRPDPTTWITVRPIPTVTDLTVALLSCEGGSPVAVLKVAHSPEAARELRTQHDALAVLHTDPRLVGWRELLPQVIEFREEENLSLVLETFLPATDLATLLSRQPHSLERVMANVLESVAQLHHRTGHLEVVDHSHLQRWVDQPLESLREMCQALEPASVQGVKRLGQTLRGSLTGRRVLVSWTHGDFTPSNVLLAADSERVSGIVDWGGARHGQLAVLDSYLMLLAVACQAEGREFGVIVTRLLRAGGLPEPQRRLLDQAGAPLPSDTRHDVLDERAIILLTWLHHVAELPHKCALYREHRVWWGLNVEPVLRAFAALAPEIETGKPTPAQVAGHTDETLGVPTASNMLQVGRSPTNLSGAASCRGQVAVKLSVSVIVCAYTEQRWDDLIKAVASVRQQTRPPEEIILVIDHCPALLRRAARELNGVQGVQVVANRHRQGLSGARNTGLEVATCEVVAFLDDDAVAAADWVGTLLDGYADPQVAGVGGCVRPNWRDKRPAWFPTEFDWVVGCSYRGLPTSRRPVRNFIGANMSFRRELLLEIGGFHTALGRIGTRPLGCEETELCIRMQRSHPNCVLLYEPAALVWHSVPASRGTWSYFRCRCYAEGLSKAAVSRLAGANQALSSERSYLSSTITRGITRCLAQGLRGRLSGIAMALAMVAGVTTTVLGYAVGRITKTKR